MLPCFVSAGSYYRDSKIAAHPPLITTKGCGQNEAWKKHSTGILDERSVIVMKSLKKSEIEGGSDGALGKVYQVIYTMLPAG